MKHFLLSSFFLISISFFAQKTGTATVKPSNLPSKKAKVNELNDFTCSLHEETVNKVLVAIGDIHGSADYEVMLIKGTYHYTITNSKINIRPDSSSFTCDAKVEVGPLDYKTQVVGDVKISYDNDSNMIYIRITRAIFELYTNVFGTRIHIKDIHLEDHFKEPFQFEGPRTLASEFEFMMPDSTKKKVFILPTECRMQLKYKEICTSCEVAAAEVKQIAPIKVIPPITDGPKASATPSASPEKK